MAYTVLPDIDDDGNYRGSYVGERQHLHHGSVDEPTDFIEDEFGQQHHVYEDVELDDDSTPNEYDDDAYVALLHEEYPDLEHAVSIAEDLLTEEEADWYNAAIDDGDHDELHAAIEFLLAKYDELEEEPDAGIDAPDEDELDEDEQDDDLNPDDPVHQWYDQLDQDFVDNEVESILTNEYSYEDALLMEKVQYDYEAGTVHGDILLVGQQIASGEVTAQEALDQILSMYGEPVAAAAYVELQQRLKNY